MGAPTKPDTIAKVVKGEWSAEQLAAIVFLANPNGGTQTALSKEIKVNRQTISEWKKLDGFMADVHRVAAVYFLEGDLQVDRAMLKAACGYEVERAVRDKKGIVLTDENGKPIIETCYVPPDVKAAELYYKRRGLLTEKHEVKKDITVEYRDRRMEDVGDEVLTELIALANGSNGASGGGGTCAPEGV